jgi:hypothetical protein
VIETWALAWNDKLAAIFEAGYECFLQVAQSFLQNGCEKYSLKIVNIFFLQGTYIYLRAHLDNTSFI